MSIRLRAFCAAVIGVYGAACGAPTTTTKVKPDFVIGSLTYGPADVSANAAGVQQAIDDINASGVLPVKLVHARVLYGDTDDRYALAQKLLNDFHAQALISYGTPTIQQIMKLTQAGAPNENVVNCGLGTSASLNDPTVPNDAMGNPVSDKNDTFYRMVAPDTKQVVVVSRQLIDPAKTGVYYINDSAGKSFATSLKNAAGKPMVVEKAYANPVVTSAETASIDAFVAASRDGSMTTMVLNGLPQTGGPIIKMLVEHDPPFAGKIVGSSGIAITDSPFGVQGTAFTQWLNTAGNQLVGVKSEVVSAENSAAWLTRYKATNGTADPEQATAFGDCAYAFAIAMMYAGDTVDGNTIKTNMPKLKISNLTGATLVTPDADGMKAAQAAIKAGKAVRLNGASGDFAFEENGDRSQQLFAVTKVTGTGPYKWANDQLWEPTTNKCVSGCQ